MTQEAWKIVWYAACGLAGVALAAALGYRGHTRGHSFWLCFLLGVVTTPLLAWVIIELLPERERVYKTPPELALAIELEKAKMRAERAANAGA
jgi:hypothetical protein